MFLAVIGEEALTSGFHAVGAHIDAPRLDLKQNPLYEDSGFALFKTHYYGGIKKYQWTTIPLALHGVVVLTDGTKIDICIGRRRERSCFSGDRSAAASLGEAECEKTGGGVPAEKLNILLGSMPMPEAGK